MKFSFSIAILFSLAVVASGLGLVSVEAQSEPPPSECIDMPNETLEEKIEKKECKVDEAQDRIAAATVNAEKLFWIEKLEIRQAALDRLLQQQLEATEPVTPEPVTPEPVTPEPVIPTPATSEPPTPTPATSEPASATHEDVRNTVDQLVRHLEILKSQIDMVESITLQTTNYQDIYPTIDELENQFSELKIHYGELGDQLKISYHNMLISANPGFSLDVNNYGATSITFLDDKFWILDRGGDDKVYAYSTDGVRHAASDFDLDADNDNPYGMTAYDGKFWVTDGDNTVYAYNPDGTRDLASDFNLDSGNDSPLGITAYDGKFWVADEYDRKVYAYNIVDGARDTDSDFSLYLDSHPRLSKITTYDGKLWVTGSLHSKIYAYNTDGTRDADSDFNLGPYNLGSTGITAYDGKFWVTDYVNDQVFVYNAE